MTLKQLLIKHFSGWALIGTTLAAQDSSTTNNVARAVNVQQYVDGFAMFIEEEKLWNIAKAHSLDFNAWTALIEETEKVADTSYQGWRGLD